MNVNLPVFLNSIYSHLCDTISWLLLQRSTYITQSD